MTIFTIENARILTLDGPSCPHRGKDLRDLGVIERGYVRVEDEAIADVGGGDPPDPSGERLDAAGRVLLPAFVDCHTHACWAGDRYDDFEKRLDGTSYLDILSSGGGIMSTVRAVRNASQDELTRSLLVRLARTAALGTGTIEVKSGYGLSKEAELKMLRAIKAAADQTDQIVRLTFLGAHAVDPENPDYVKETIEKTLPAVVSEFGPIPCDAYCEQGAWSLDDTRQLFEQAKEFGCPLRVHTDQFNSLGMTRLAIEMETMSVDHLEAATPDDLERLAASDTIGVALPCTGFSLDDRYAPARGFVDAGGALAIASNYNPGSSPTPSMDFAIALACRKLGLTPAEAITAATINPACVLGLDTEVGSIEPGKRADMQLMDFTDERELGYEFATPGPWMTITAGNIVLRRPLPTRVG